MPTADALGFVDWKSHALQCSQPENGKTEKLKEISFCGSCISEKPKLKLMIQLHSNDNFLKAILLLDMNSRPHCARGVAMDTARAWIFQGLQQPLRFHFQRSFICDESKCRLMLISVAANFKSSSPVPLGIDKSAHDKQNEAICHPLHSLAGNPLEIPSCELDRTGQQDSNAGQLQKMSWENHKRKREGAEATMNKTTNLYLNFSSNYNKEVVQ